MSLVSPAALFPTRLSGLPTAGGVTVPFGLGLSSRPGPVAGPIPTPARLVYSPEMQVATVDGHPAVSTEYGDYLMAKKANTVEDSQTDTEETNQ